MKKGLVICLSIVFCALFAQSAYAASTDTLNITVTVTPTLSVEITETDLALGTIGIGATKASTAAVTVTNDSSGVAETYELMVTNPAGWSADTAGTNQYVLNAAFNSDSSVTWNPTNHALSTTSVECTATKFAGDQTGASVPSGATRKLWFQFKAPTSTDVTTQQTMVLTVTATLP